jgi:hypothetical protein
MGDETRVRSPTLSLLRHLREQLYILGLATGTKTRERFRAYLGRRKCDTVLIDQLMGRVRTRCESKGSSIILGGRVLLRL